MNKRSFILGLLLTLVIIFSFIPSIAPVIIAQNGWVINGTTVYTNDAKAYLSANPHTLSGSGWIEFSLISKQWSGYIDVVWGLPSGYNISVSKPQRWALNVSHVVNQTELVERQYTRQINDILSWQEIGWGGNEQPDIGNLNNIYLALVEIGVSGNSTIIYVAHNSYIQNSPSSVTFNGNYNNPEFVTHYEYYDDWISWNPPAPEIVNYSYEGVSVWHIIELDQYITAGQIYKVRCWLNVPFTGLDQWTLKYVWAAKPQAQTLQQAIAAGNLYLLDPWITGGWSYRKQIPVTGSSGAESNYQVKLTVYTGSGTDAAGVVYLSSHCTNFPVDIAFTDDDGTTELYHWYETNVGSDSTYRVFWIKITDNLDTNRVFYIYYGKSGGSSTYKDGDNTFIFFDDFPNSSIDLTKWTGATSYATVSGGICTISGGGTAWRTVYSIKNVGSSISCASKSRANLDVSEAAIGPCNPLELHKGMAYRTGTATKILSCDGTTQSVTDTTLTIDSYRELDILVRDATNVRILEGGSEPGSPKTSNPPNDSGMRAGMAAYGTNALLVDWIFLRKYIYTEPTVGTAGSEQATCASTTQSTPSPTANSGSGWTNPTNAYADGTSSATQTSGGTTNTYTTYGFSVSTDVKQVRVRTDSWCSAGEATTSSPLPPGGQISDPDSNTCTATVSTGTKFFAVVDEQPNYNDADYYTMVDNAGGRVTVTSTAFAIPETATITDVVIYYRGYNSGTASFRPSLKIGSTYYDSLGTVRDPSAWTTYSDTFTQNPARSAAWQVSDLNRVNGDSAYYLNAFGTASTDCNPDNQISWLYLVADYTYYNEKVRVAVSWDGGTSWSSDYDSILTSSEQTIWTDVTSATSWTGTKLNDSNFQVRVSSVTSGTTSTVSLDWIPVEATYCSGCSPSISLDQSSWSVNSGSAVIAGSNYNTGITWCTITNNSGGAISITIGGTDMTGGGYTWDLSDDGSAGNMIYGMYSGLDDLDDTYDVVVKEAGPYNTLVASLADSATQDFGLKIYVPTVFSDGNSKSGTVTLTAVCI